MTTETEPIQIRPFRDEDRPAIVAFRNARRPGHLQETVAEWERGEAQWSRGEVRVQLCVGDPPVAYLSATDRGTSAYRKEGTCGLGLWVAAEHQRQGIGSALYEHAERFARERGLTRMWTYVRLFRPDEPAVRFLEKRGFVEQDRDVPVMLDVASFDPAPHVRALPVGLRLLSLAEAGDTEANRREVYALDGLIHVDLPTHDVLPERPDFEQWNKLMEGPEYDPRAVILAEDAGGTWVGLSVLGFQEHTNVGWTNITGVRREWRGRGLATALKLKAIAAARDRGCSLILTENHEDNAPMRAINRKLGFTPDAPGVTYGKNL